VYILALTVACETDVQTSALSLEILLEIYKLCLLVIDVGPTLQAVMMLLVMCLAH
jgi:hypothetical protein